MILSWFKNHPTADMLGYMTDGTKKDQHRF